MKKRGTPWTNMNRKEHNFLDELTKSDHRLGREKKLERKHSPSLDSLERGFFWWAWRIGLGVAIFLILIFFYFFIDLFV